MECKETTSQDFVDETTIAEHFGVSKATIRRWVRAGRIPHYWVTDKVVRFSLAEVKAALRRPVACAGGCTE